MFVQIMGWVAYVGWNRQSKFLYEIEGHRSSLGNHLVKERIDSLLDLWTHAVDVFLLENRLHHTSLLHMLRWIHVNKSRFVLGC